LGIWLIPVVLIVALAGVGGYTYLALTNPTTYNVHTTGIVVQGSALFKVCMDPTGLQEVNAFSWGTLAPGMNTSVIFYIINIGTAPATFSFATSNWAPVGADTYIIFAYTINPAPLNPGQFRKVAFSLHVDPSITSITDFSFDVVVTGTA
jgi:hypothetical protein